MASVCSVCSRSIFFNADGLIRPHGPVQKCCPGSHKLPASSGSHDLLASCPSKAIPSRVPRAPSATSIDLPFCPSTDSSPCPSAHLPSRVTVKILKWIPKASRLRAGQKLSNILEDIVEKNDHASWTPLFCFGRRCLRAPWRGGEKRFSLATLVNKQLDAEPNLCDVDDCCSKGPQPLRRDSIESLTACVSSKVEEGDFRGAIRLASSECTLAPVNESTFMAL